METNYADICVNCLHRGECTAVPRQIEVCRLKLIADRMEDEREAESKVLSNNSSAIANCDTD